MSEAEKYRAFARKCMRWAERAQNSVEHREALLDMAAAWAEVAAQLEHRFALIEQFTDLARETKKNLEAAADGHWRPAQGNGAGQTNQTDDYSGSEHQSGERRDASAK
jgi:hypothetical protein